MQRVNSHGFALEVPVSGITDLANKTLRVVLTRPDDTSFERTTEEDDIEVFSDTLIGVRIIDGDFSIAGTYQLQIWDETTGSVKSDIIYFEVGPSLEAPEA